MAFDPIDPADPRAVDVLAEDENRDETEPRESEEALEIAEETPEADAAEQHTDVAPRGDEPLEELDPSRGDEADLLEQNRTVSVDEDDYR
ncbi:hypothetical protein ACFV6E_14970 [Streptomyces sp. NPDC059785]|uniref:hypothetical protein n=1 Tax=unclassified Streptomyces TaxID=2593676 RepID=UPI00365FFC52